MRGGGDNFWRYCKIWDLRLTISGDHFRRLDLRHYIKSSADDCERCDRDKERDLLRDQLARRLDGQGVQCGVAYGSFYSLGSDDCAVFQSRVRFVVQRKWRKPTHPTTESESGPGRNSLMKGSLFHRPSKICQAKFLLLKDYYWSFWCLFLFFSTCNPLIIKTKVFAAIAIHYLALSRFWVYYFFFHINSCSREWWL